MTLTINNKGPGSALSSFEMECDRALSFDKGGFKANENENLGELAAGQSVQRIFWLYSKPMTKTGPYRIKVKATEHFNTYSLVKKEYPKIAELIVEE